MSRPVGRIVLPTMITPRSSLSFPRILLPLASAVLAATALLAAPPPLHVRGTRLVAESGAPVRLRGVNCASLEWSVDGDGHIAKSIDVAVTQWHANLIRLPLSQDRWFGKTPEQQDGGAAYRALVRRLVDFVAAHDAYIILDLHWSDAGEWGRHIGQHDLPDINSVAFWKDAAAAYRNEPAVLFDLYNEPTRTDWDHWFKGGPISEIDEKTKDKLEYESVGLQALVDTIRSTGAKNVIVAGGLNWSYEVGGILDGRVLDDHGGRGVVYAQHPYPHAYEGLGLETIAQWAARIAAFAGKQPVIVTEFGSIEKWWPFPKDWHYDDEKWNREMLRVLEAHEWNWTAWDFHPTAEPSLIEGWHYMPTPHFGVWVKEALAKNIAPAQP